MKSEIQELMIDNNVEDEIVDEWVNITNEKMKRYQELVGRLKGCLEDYVRRKKQEERLKRRMEEELKIEEMKLEMKKKNEDNDIIVNKNIQVKLP